MEKSKGTPEGNKSCVVVGCGNSPRERSVLLSPKLEEWELLAPYAHMLECLVPASGTVWEGLGVALLEEVYHWGWPLRFRKPILLAVVII